MYKVVEGREIEVYVQRKTYNHWGGGNTFIKIDSKDAMHIGDIFFILLK